MKKMNSKLTNYILLHLLKCTHKWPLNSYQQRKYICFLCNWFVCDFIQMSPTLQEKIFLPVQLTPLIMLSVVFWYSVVVGSFRSDENIPAISNDPFIDTEIKSSSTFTIIDCYVMKEFCKEEISHFTTNIKFKHTTHFINIMKMHFIQCKFTINCNCQIYTFHTLISKYFNNTEPD